MNIHAAYDGAFVISELTDEEAKVLIQAGIDAILGNGEDGDKYFERLKELAHDDLENWEDDADDYNDGEGM